MKILKLVSFIFLLFFSLKSFGQNKAEWKNFLDTYCEEYFEDCFSWKYYEIISIDKINPVTTNVYEVTGIVKNEGVLWPVTRVFKATVKFYDEKIIVNFKKQGDYGGDSFWTDCKNTLYY